MLSDWVRTLDKRNHNLRAQASIHAGFSRVHGNFCALLLTHLGIFLNLHSHDSRFPTMHRSSCPGGTPGIILTCHSLPSLIASHALWLGRAVGALFIFDKILHFIFLRIRFEVGKLKHHVCLQTRRLVNAEKVQPTVRQMSESQQTLSHARRNAHLVASKRFSQKVKSKLELLPRLGSIHCFKAGDHGQTYVERDTVPSGTPSISYTQAISIPWGRRKAPRLIAK